MDSNAAAMTEGGGNGNGMSASSATNGANANSGGTEEAQPQLFCLRWNNYQTNLTCSFDQLLQSELLVDVTLACADGQFMKAHRMVLSACSPYFQTLFSDNPCKHPIVILKDIGWSELKAVVEFMYKGEINVCQEQIEPLLKVAESLKIRGLADVSSGQDFARAAAASTAERRSPPAPDAPIRASPSRSVSAAGGPQRKRRRTSADRTNGDDAAAATAAFSAALNSPSRALELISAPASVNVTAAQSAQPHQSQPQQHANRPPSQSSAQSPPTMPSVPIAPPPHTTANAMASTSSVDDMEIKPGIAEMIREEERAKMFESSQAWLNASTSSLAYVQPSDYDSSTSSLPSMQSTFGCGSVPAGAVPVGTVPAGAIPVGAVPAGAVPAGAVPAAAVSGAGAAGEPAPADFGALASPAEAAAGSRKAAPSKVKTPSWTKAQLRQAIKAVITQQLRFTEASAAYNIPKGTLYDNILGKTKRMRGLDVAALADDEEAAVLEFCCQVSTSAYNRRTPRALHEVLRFVEGVVRRRDPGFRFDEMSGFRWWWAFCKKHSVLVLNYTSLKGETFVEAGCDRVRGDSARAKAVKRYMRHAKTTQLRLDAHAYVARMSDADQPFDFSTRNAVPSAASAPTSSGTAQIPLGAAQIPSGAAQTPSAAALIPSGAALIPSGAAQIPSGAALIPSGAAPIPSGAAPTFSSVAPVSSSAAPVSAGLAFGLAPGQLTGGSAGVWTAQQFLSAFGPLNESLFGGAPGPIQEILNSLMKEESVT